MASKINPEITIEFDRPRHLRFDINAMAVFEELTGLNLMNPKVQKKINNNMTIVQFRAFLYACLVHEDETLTLKQVGSFINTANMNDIIRKFNQAVEAAAPEAGEGTEKDPL